MTSCSKGATSISPKNRLMFLDVNFVFTLHVANVNSVKPSIHVGKTKNTISYKFKIHNAHHFPVHKA